MKATDQLDFLREFYREKHAMLQRHVAVARQVSHYDFNNTYQYIIAREEMHVRWVGDAIVDMGGVPEEQAQPELSTSGRGKGAALEASFISEDRDGAQQFVDRWRSRVDAHPNARHRSMLRVILGETLEQKRFFEQAVAGRTGQ